MRSSKLNKKTKYPQRDGKTDVTDLFVLLLCFVLFYEGYAWRVLYMSVLNAPNFCKLSVN